MESDIYQLVLTSEQGWSLYGTVHMRLVDATATGGVTVPPMLQPTLEPGRAEVALIPMEAEVHVPVLSPFRQVCVRGLAYGSAAGLFSIALDSGAAWPRVGLQIFPLSGRHYGGLLIWSASNFTEAVFSVQARQLPRLS